MPIGRGDTLREPRDCTQLGVSGSVSWDKSRKIEEREKRALETDPYSVVSNRKVLEKHVQNGKEEEESANGSAASRHSRNDGLHSLEELVTCPEPGTDWSGREAGQGREERKAPHRGKREKADRHRDPKTAKTAFLCAHDSAVFSEVFYAAAGNKEGSEGDTWEEAWRQKVDERWRQ